MRLFGREGHVRDVGEAGAWTGLTGALWVGGRVSSPGDKWVREDPWEWVGEV